MNSALIGKRIRTIREEKGWKQEVFAEKVGLSPTYIGMIERGEKIPKTLKGRRLFCSQIAYPHISINPNLLSYTRDSRTL